MKNITDIAPAKADQDTWLKGLGVDAATIRNAAAGGSAAPSTGAMTYTYQVSADSPADVLRGAQPASAYDSLSDAKPGGAYAKFEESPAEGAPAPINTYSVAPDDILRRPSTAGAYAKLDESPAEGASPPNTYSMATDDILRGGASKSAYGSPDDADDDLSAEAKSDESPEAIAAARRSPLGDIDKSGPAATPADTGMKSKRVDAKYDGEHNQAGWRQEMWKMGGKPVDPENTHITTKLYSEEEQARNQLVQQADGSFKRGATATDNQSMGFVMDASGRMVAFNDGVSGTGPDGRPTLPGASPFSGLKDGGRVEATHHSTALGGEVVLDEHGKPKLDKEGRPIMRSKAAALAGTVAFDDDGKIETISNQSGHYKPTVDYLLQGVEYLTRQGAFFEDEVVRMTDHVAEGEKYKALRDSDPDYKLYKKVQAKIVEGTNLKGRVNGLVEGRKSAEGKRDQREAARIDAELEKLKGEYDTIRAFVDKSSEELRKKGVGPSNRMRGDAKAEFLDIKPGMTGADVRLAATKKMEVEKFAKTGGGNEAQAARKAAMLEDLKKNPTPRKGKGKT
jgi:hypothetical protein